MFKNNKKQYISLFKYENQLQVSYKILQNSVNLKQENSSFLVQDNNMPKDAIYKLTTLQKAVSKSYISTFYDNDTQYIVENSTVNTKVSNFIKLDDKYSAVVNSDDLSLFSNFFKDVGLDYIFSPFSVLYDQINNNSTKNSINIFVSNNKLYTIVYDKNGHISKSIIKKITDFDSIKDSHFYNDEIAEQKLYDEVYFLEFQQILNDIIQESYTNNTIESQIDFFESINIFYTTKQLSGPQIDIILDTLMVEINYNQLSIETFLEKSLENKNAEKFSFIKPRDKKIDKSVILWIAILIISIIGIAGTIYYKSTQSEAIEKSKKVVKVDKIIKEKIIEEIPLRLPNHIQHNNNIVEQAMMFFNLIPYDAILLELSLGEDSSTFVTNFLLDSNGSKVLTKKLSIIYNKSQIILEHKTKAIVSTIISNTNHKAKKEIIEKTDYVKHKFISSDKFTKYLNSIVPNQSEIKFISKSYNENLKYDYTIKSFFKTPQEFFTFIDKLNKKDIPLLVNYPIEFTKLENELEIKYNLSFYQKDSSSSKVDK